MGSKEGSRTKSQPRQHLHLVCSAVGCGKPSSLICMNTDRMGTSDRHGYLNRRPYCNGKKE